MVYDCIKEFWVDIVDGDGRTEKQDGMHIRKGSMWKVDNEAVNVMGTDIHLDELTGMNWLELSKEKLDNCFKVIECEESCKSNVTSCNHWNTDKCKVHK